jgi:asparagine synthase (glutamine-hydrolysing)
MCGILGTVDRGFDRRVLDLISHRGPDDSAISECSAGNHLVTLGHRRLSILDLSAAGSQPMWTPCGRYAIVFNGEIYNHMELRDRSRVAYRGHSDTETILHRMARNGPSAAREFNGIYSFAFLDIEKEKLFLARDPFGVKPLYYSTEENALVFASELRPFKEFMNASLDMESLAELLRLRYLPAPDTLFKGIHKLRPGHLLEVDLGKRRITASEYPFTARSDYEGRIGNGAEILERYEFLAEQAVRRQLLSDVEIGVLLSGGVDSALIASIAQRHSNQRMKAFTVGFAGHEAVDEIDEARETARILGLDHHDVRLGLPEFLDLLPRITSIVEEPLATTSVVPMFYLASLAASHVKVVLSGQGADEAMGGYRRYRAEVLRSRVPGFAVPLLRSASRFMGPRSSALLRGLDSMEEHDEVRRFESIYSVFGKECIGRLIGRDETRANERIRYCFELLRCSEQPNSVTRMMSIDLRMNLADDLLLYTDKITMHHSLECRVPLLDLELIRFVESLPSRYRVRVLQNKIIHKRCAERVLPNSITKRKKRGFESPTANWFRRSGAVRDILLDRSARFSSFFDLSEVERVLDEHSAGMDRERHIFLLLSLHHWMSECLGSAKESMTALTIA